MEPITGNPDAVISLLLERVWEIVEDRYLERFYIGRASDMKARQSYHQSDDLVLVYKTTNVDQALEVEEDLIEAHKKHSKCANKAGHEGGGLSSEGVQYVYVAVWLRDRV